MSVNLTQRQIESVNSITYPADSLTLPVLNPQRMPLAWKKLAGIDNAALVFIMHLLVHYKNKGGALCQIKSVTIQIKSVSNLNTNYNLIVQLTYLPLFFKFQKGKRETWTLRN